MVRWPGQRDHRYIPTRHRGYRRSRLRIHWPSISTTKARPPMSSLECRACPPSAQGRCRREPIQARVRLVAAGHPDAAFVDTISVVGDIPFAIRFVPWRWLLCRPRRSHPDLDTIRLAIRRPWLPRRIDSASDRLCAHPSGSSPRHCDLEKA